MVPPRQLPHRQTFIILHGRGSWADRFGPVLLETPVAALSAQSSSSLPASPVTLSNIFPHARFVFPTAARTRATIYARSLTHQWFDNWKLDPSDTEERSELQIPGLRASTGHIHALIRAQIQDTPGGAPNVVLAGLSQGSATALLSLLLWEGESLAAAFGMAGWLPFCANLRGEMEEEKEEDGECDDDDLFERQDREEDKGDLDPPQRAVAWLRETLDVPELCPKTDRGGGGVMPYQKTPVFLGHGVLDDRVDVILGRNAAACVGALGARVVAKEYESLGHWYSGEMLRDIVDFITDKTGWACQS